MNRILKYGLLLNGLFIICTLRATNEKESFGYDNLNRLTDWAVYHNNVLQTANSISYSSTTGLINSKSDLGNYAMAYGENGQPPHALTSISGIPDAIGSDRTITYTDFKKVRQIIEGDSVLNITYGADEQRVKTLLAQPSDTLTRYYMGNYEEEVRGGVTRKIHYISGGNGLAAIYVQNAGSDTLYYVHTDYQGSLIALSLPNGTVKERYAFDPWGNRRDPSDWTQADSRTAFVLNRGYTMHEHLDLFKLINMNGRVYDPLTSQFFSLDPYLQTPSDWLNYNRYSYAFNNPLIYTDPSGEFFWIFPYFSFDKGGISFGISAGIGFGPKFGISASVGYSTGDNSFTATAGASFGMANAYIGYNSNAGFIAGAGIGFGSVYNGNYINISSNIMNIGLNYSAKGGLSGNYMGLSISQHGVSFNPSISIGMTLRKGQTISATGDIGVTENYNADISTNEQLMQLLASKDIDISDYYANFIDIENQLPQNVIDAGYVRASDGTIGRTGSTTRSRIGGITVMNWNWFSKTSQIYMSPHNSTSALVLSLNHEFIHSWQFRTMGNRMSRKEFGLYTEASASLYTQQFYSSFRVPQYMGVYNLYNWPSFPHMK